MDVNSVRWLNYSQDESAARKAFSRLKASALGGPGKLELRYDGETGDWLVVLYNIICGTSESLENAYGIPACPNADSWFPYEGATKVDNYAGASTVEDAFKVPMTIEGLRKAAKEMAGQYYSCRPDVMCPDEAMRRLRSGEAKKTERATGTMRQRAHTSADDTDSCSQIRFKCKHCGKTLVVKESLAGQRGKCPHCKQVLSLPKQAGSEETIRRDAVDDVNIDALAAGILEAPEESPKASRAQSANEQPRARINILCPSCSTSHSVSEAAVGKKTNCRACGAVFTLKRPVADAPSITGHVRIRDDRSKMGKSFDGAPAKEDILKNSRNVAEDCDNFTCCCCGRTHPRFQEAFIEVPMYGNVRQVNFKDLYINGTNISATAQVMFDRALVRIPRCHFYESTCDRANRKFYLNTLVIGLLFSTGATFVMWLTEAVGNPVFAGLLFAAVFVSITWSMYSQNEGLKVYPWQKYPKYLDDPKIAELRAERWEVGEEPPGDYSHRLD